MSNNTIPGPFKTCGLPILPCVKGNVFLITKSIGGTLDHINSLDAYADEVSIITHRDTNNILTYKNSDTPLITTLQNPETATSVTNMPYKVELVCYDRYGNKYVYDNRGSSSFLWSIKGDNPWNQIVVSGLDDIIDMCYDSGNCLFLLSNDFVITVINIDESGIANSVNQYAARNSTFDGKGLYNCMTVSKDHIVYVCRQGRAIYKIEPFADEFGNPLKDYDTLDLSMSNGDSIPAYDAIDPSEIIAGDPNTSGYVDGPDPLFNYITSMSIDSYQHIYVCDRDSQAIRCIYEDLSKTITIVGPSIYYSGPYAGLRCPRIVRATNLSDGQCVLYVADSYHCGDDYGGWSIRKIT
jgi:hypothetical protein